MPLVSEFLERFKQYSDHQNKTALLSLNMPDDMTVWGPYEQNEYNLIQSLHNRALISKAPINSVTIDFERLDVFGNGLAMAVICRCKRSVTLKTGSQLNDDNLRVTFYLVEHNGSLKIRHSHSSNEWNAEQAFPAGTTPEQDSSGSSSQGTRLSLKELGPFTELLNKRAAYVRAANQEGLIELHHPNSNNVYWPVFGATLTGREQYRNHLLFLKDHFKEPELKYRQPVVFKNQDLACMSVFCEATYINEERVRCHIAPLRVTYILQEKDKQWRCRHSHWSLPSPSVFI